MTIFWKCEACSDQQKSPVKPAFCLLCGRPDTYSLLGENFSNALHASEIVTEAKPRHETGDKELDVALYGGFVKPSKVLVWGVPGVGKSRSAMRWATHLGNTMVVALEMPADLTVESANGSGSDLNNLFVTTSDTNWIEEASRYRCKIVVYDSLHESSKKPKIVLAELKTWSDRVGGIAIVIGHTNKKGSVSGPRTYEHWSDYNLDMKMHGQQEIKIIVGKSRYCPRGNCIIPLM